MADEQNSIDLNNPIEGLVSKVEIQELKTKSETTSLITCVFCTVEEVRNCRKCNRPFCTNHTHRFSPDFCQDCFKNISVIADKFTRTTEEYDHQSDSLVTRKESCNRLRLDGPDYPFLTLWISQLSDEEIFSVYEFHYFIVKMIEHDNEIRKIGKQKKLRETPVSKFIGVTKTTETRVKKEAKPKDLAAELKKLGLPQSVIDAMVAASGGAK